MGIGAREWQRQWKSDKAKADHGDFHVFKTLNLRMGLSWVDMGNNAIQDWSPPPSGWFYMLNVVKTRRFELLSGTLCFLTQHLEGWLCQPPTEASPIFSLGKLVVA
jgi:hypothetical protein